MWCGNIYIADILNVRVKKDSKSQLEEQSD